MKTKLSKILIPLLAILFAIGESITSQAAQQETNVKIKGYFSVIGVNPPCSLYLNCNTEIRPRLCTVIYQGQIYQAFGKINVNDTTCIIVLYDNTI